MKPCHIVYLRRNGYQTYDTTILTMVSFHPSSGADFLFTPDQAQTRHGRGVGGRYGRGNLIKSMNC